ncbi:HHL029Wp [Eremothecium sinecaudum]|uniref:HHL029Wp n=1 Tax=Eremothecium sinecaudum TaxID=45286 RepID=A0A109UYJ5_9SACH|nr:HHL029Wp [Eremothecium sinecaudum]AMD22741.1 HHL029Wp [Eremothecium sinecaudum]
MKVTIQHLINRYHSKDELINSGIWDGTLYNPGEERFFDRSWCWRTLLLSGHNDNNWSDSPSPPAFGEHSIVFRALTDCIPSSEVVEIDDRLKDHQQLDEQLQSIKLDVCRLKLDKIFTEAKVQQDLANILIKSVKETGRPYKQGYHELCAVFYMQLRRDDYNDDICESVSQMFNILLKHIKEFYIESNLINWTRTTFEPLLEHAFPQLHKLLLHRHCIDNSIWLIRWSRLLFLREFELSYTLQLWDHLFSFRYPLPDLVAAVAVTCQGLVEQDLNKCEDVGDILGILLRYPTNRLLSPRHLMQSAGSLLDSYSRNCNNKERPLGFIKN